jgi:hypothetical protein
LRCVFQGQKAISVSRSGPWLSRRPSTAVCRVHRRLLKQNGPWAGRCKVHVPPSLSAGSPATTGEGKCKLSCSRAKAQKAPLRSNPMQLDGLCARRNQLWCWRTGSGPASMCHRVRTETRGTLFRSKDNIEDQGHICDGTNWMD